MSLFNELKRRNVFRVGIAYAVASWVLLQVVDLVFDYITAPAWIMQLFMLALAIGFPLVLILAWVFELTPEGLKREASVEPSQSVTSQTGRKLDRIIIAFLALAVVILLGDRFRTGADAPAEGVDKNPAVATATTEKTGSGISTPSQNEKSIAVLPLANRSVQPEDAFFAEGLHDELLTQLSRISALRVISRTSVMGYAGTTKRMPEIGRELGVATLLEGGVQRSGNRVRINVQLIEAATDEHLWAEVYDRELTADNLFDIQSDITRAIAKALQAVLTGDEQQSLDQKPTDNVDAYSYYLRGKAAATGYGRTIAQIDESIGSFRTAIKLDPGFAAAYAALSIDWAERYWNSDKLGEDMQHALNALQRAQALAPESSETLTAEGYYHYWGFLDYAPAIRAFERALEREPGNTIALRGKAYVLRRMGRLEEAIADMERIISLDPLVAEMTVDAGYTLLRAGQIERAEVFMNRAFTLAPEKLYVVSTRSELFLVKGDLETARQSLGPTIGRDAASYYLDYPLLIGRALGDDELVDRVLDNYALWDSQGLGLPFARALVMLDRGEHDKLKVLVDELEASARLAQIEQPGKEHTLLNQVILHALQQDRAKLADSIKAYYAGVKPDAMRIIDNRTIPIAYAIAGDSDALLDYLEELVAQFGPWEFYYFTLDPSFKDMRDLPRFQALDRQYRQWLEQHP